MVNETILGLKQEEELISRVGDEKEKYSTILQIENQLRREGIELSQEQEGLLGDEIDRLQDMQKMRSIGDEIGSGFAKGFSQATMHAKNFEGALDAIGDAALNVVDRIMEITIWEPMAQSLSKSITGAMTKSEFGNAFMGGHLQAFGLGDVVSRPTFFRFANGIGVMGEAGDEAIMPLKRTSSGRLGVETTGASFSPSVSVHVTNNSQAQVEATPADVRFDGHKIAIGMLLRDKRNNGPFARATKGG